MRIRFVTLYFPPEIGAAQRRISELARGLVRRGHQVTVLTGFPIYPTGIRPAQYKGRIFMRETIDGVSVIRVPHFVAPNKGFAKRLLIHLTFAFSASIYSLVMKRDDVIYLESPPLFNGFIGVLSKWFRRIPYLFNLADLWPQTAVELGILRNRQIIAAASFLERFFYRRAAKILAITNGLRTELIRRGYPENRVPLLTNGVDVDVFRDDISPDREIASYRRDDGLLVLYAGTHGLIYSLDTILETADLMRKARCRFLFIGDGAEKERLIALAAEKNLTNVTFLPPRPPQDMPAVFRAADVAVISLKDLAISRSIMPLKCFEIMACGVPIILAAKGEMQEHISRSGCGRVIAPENAQALADALTSFACLSADGRAEIGHKGRDYAIRNFSRQAGIDRLETLLREAVPGGK